MGSFVFNSHVRAGDAALVARLAAESLAARGYSPAPEANAARTIHVFESHHGWVSLLDSDFADALELLGDLSRRLDTRTLFVAVHDSDSWHYVLFDRGETSGDFSSPPGEEPGEIGELPPELARLLDAGAVEEFQQELDQRTESFQRRLEDLIPAEIREIQRKLADATASPNEMRTFLDWTREELPQLSEQLRTIAHHVFGAGDVPAEAASAESKPPSMSDRIDCLRPILVPDATDELLREILERRSLFAEETLAEFLPLCGLPPDFAYLETGDLERAESNRDPANGTPAVHLTLHFEKPV